VREPQARRAPLEGGGDPRVRRTSLEGGGDPRARRTSLESDVSPRARRTSLEGAFCWAASVGRGGHRGVDCVVRIFRVRPEVGFAFYVFLEVLSRVPPGFLGDPHGCPRQMLSFGLVYTYT
jgi:hypothetical protein